MGIVVELVVGTMSGGGLMPRWRRFLVHMKEAEDFAGRNLDCYEFDGGTDGGGDAGEIKQIKEVS